MIHVDRSTANAPESLTLPNGPGAQETKAAIAFYRVRANKLKAFPFKVYKKDKAISKCLNELFHYKCAYCESNFGATQPVDVEHFRPKAGKMVNGKLEKPGYYWLAATWTNLLPSCTDCNRTRKQEVPGGQPQNMGKANQFPVALEAKRATRPGQEEREERLLLDPCVDDPDAHLVFEPQEKDLVIVRPTLLAGGKESPMGKESIRVYALQRPGLVQARGDRMKIIKAQVTRVTRLFGDLNECPEDQETQQRLKEEMNELNRLLADDQAYAGMARQYVARTKVLEKVPG